MKPFDSNIIKIIDKLSYDMFVVQQNFEIDCACVNFTTKQADPNCTKCLGTGKKIEIKKIKGAAQNNKTSFSVAGVGEVATGGAYYMKSKYKIYQDNIIVNGPEIAVVQRVEPLRSDNIEPVYYRCEATPKKSGVQIFLKNFNKIIRRG